MDSLVSSMTTQRVTRGRFLVVFMLFITVVINYLDRANMAVAAPALRQSFGLDPHQLGFVLSASLSRHSSTSILRLLAIGCG